MGSGKREKPVEEETDKLPLPELADGARGELGIDKNINEEVIDQYLNRSDSVYRDMRMLEDPGDYEYLKGGCAGRNRRLQGNQRTGLQRRLHPQHGDGRGGSNGPSVLQCIVL